MYTYFPYCRARRDCGNRLNKSIFRRGFFINLSSREMPSKKWKNPIRLEKITQVLFFPRLRRKANKKGRHPFGTSHKKHKPRSKRNIPHSLDKVIKAYFKFHRFFRTGALPRLSYIVLTWFLYSLGFFFCLSCVSDARPVTELPSAGLKVNLLCRIRELTGGTPPYLPNPVP